MRKMASSGKTLRRMPFRVLADSRSRPKGFSRITRACSASPAWPRCSTTTANMLGGMAR